MKTILTSLFLMFQIIPDYGQKVIFLHHSTGGNLYSEGKVANWISNYNSNNSTNYQISEFSYPDTPYPWNNYPYDYWNLWINGACNSESKTIECINTICSNYNVIIFKHCFPGAHIYADEAVSSASSSKKTLGNYKLQYRALRSLMDSYPQNKFIIWTLVPLHRLATNEANAARAKQFVDWVKNEWLTEDGKSHPNIYIFDFWSYAAESNATPVNGKINCLKYEYERSHTATDSHPNTMANIFIGPKFAEFVVNVLKNQLVVKVNNIEVNGNSGVSSINSDKGYLQMNAKILPENASNKNIVWSLSSGNDFATISSTGLLAALKNGTVSVKASSTDGSGIFGTKNILINNQIVKVNSILVTGTNNMNTISTPNGSLQLVASILPNDANNKSVTWSIVEGNTYASLSNNGLLAALKNGIVKVNAKANDGSNVKGEMSITISGQSTKREVINRDSLKFFPNPSTDFIFLNKKIDTNNIISIYTLSGQKVKELVIENNCINISDLKRGCYLIYLEIQDLTFKEKIVVF